MKRTPIHEIQGDGLHSPLAGTQVVARGVVTGTTRNGYFVQDPDGGAEGSSHAVFVFSPKHKPTVGALVDVRGKVTDFTQDESDRPTTQIHAKDFSVVADQGPTPKPIWITAETLELDNAALAAHMNSLEGMLVGIEAGATFIAPSNPFGDYVVAPAGSKVTHTRHGGALVDPDNPGRWFPSFRIIDSSRAPQVNVGAVLLTPVVGPLNFRVASFQISALGRIRVRPKDVVPDTTTLRPQGNRVTVLTLNGFNLDPHVEDPRLVKDPHRDVDDDVGDGRYRRLGAVIARDAAVPDIVALQEMQDDDGAEITDVVDASENYGKLIECVRSAGGPEYAWIDIPPVVGADGGQPGGNIRNGFLFNPDRVEVVADSLRRIGDDEAAFVDSRKPLMASFRLRETRQTLAIINVHLASKRHQHGLFAPQRPGFDPRLEIRVQQAKIVRQVVADLAAGGIDSYVTGDFNDFEFSETLSALVADDSVNLTERVPLDLRYDYNHRGKSQALMHGIVGKEHAASCSMEYEILHGNELVGAQPGVLGDKATDHAYVIARIEVR